MSAKPIRKPRAYKSRLLVSVASVLLLGWEMPPALGVVVNRTPEEAVRAYEDSINARSVEGLLATTAESLDVRLYRSDGTLQYQKSRSRLEQRKSFEEMLRLNPNSHTHIVSLVASGPVVIERGETTWLPNGASEIGLSLFRVLDGRITQLWILNAEGPKQGGGAAP